MFQGTVKIINHESEVLKSNPLGDPFVRELYVYLPPDYEAAPDQKFPVAYCLTGFTGRGKMLLNDTAFAPNLAERMDKLIAEKIVKPMIIVMPDCFTFFGGSQYINSSATGNYEDYLIREIVPFVDQTFRTIGDKNSRAVFGKSSGGYGALVLAIRHPEIFGLCASISGDCYFELSYLPDFPKAFRALKGDSQKFIEKFLAEEKKGKNDFPALNILGMSACYSPDENEPLGVKLPFDLQSGEIIPDVWQKWLANDPVRMVEKHTEALQSLNLLFLDAGTRDEFALDVGARVLSKRLSDSNIPHIHEEFDDGHFGINYRYNRTLELISEKISR